MTSNIIQAVAQTRIEDQMRVADRRREARADESRRVPTTSVRSPRRRRWLRVGIA